MKAIKNGVENHGPRHDGATQRYDGQCAGQRALRPLANASIRLHDHLLDGFEKTE